MITDLDRLMAERNLDAIVVEGPDGMGSANPAFNYLVRGQHLTGVVIKRRGQPATLIHSAWEVEQAKKTGLELLVSTTWPWREILKEKGNLLDATVEYRRQIFASLGITGRVGFYGTDSIGRSYAILRGMERAVPALEVVAEIEQDILDVARLTKDAEEIAALKAVGERAVAVVAAVEAFLRSCRADGDVVVRNGTPVTVGDVHAVIERESATRGLENPQGFIFAQGREAGLPHAHGTPSDVLRPGAPIVFDYYPRAQSGGFYHDMTRTFALGYATPELEALYKDVMDAFEHVTSEFEPGAPTRAYQDMTCEFLEARGHETIKTKYPIEAGYIHGLGHGIGLEVHEDLTFSSLRDRGDIIQPGAVFTVEPGLYYPERGLGVRIEDTYVCTPDGRFESITPYPKQLVIPLEGA